MSDDLFTCLSSQTPTFDELIMSEIRLEDKWVGVVETRPDVEPWFVARESVRKLSEGLHYKPSRRPNKNPQEAESVLDRFRAVWPNVTGKWTRMNARDNVSVGPPIDPV